MDEWKSRPFEVGDEVRVYDTNLGSLAVRGVSDEELRSMFPPTPTREIAGEVTQ